MATRSTLGYIDETGEFRGTYINWDGTDLESAAQKRFETEGYEAMVEWIELGIAGGGFSSVDDAEPYGDGGHGVITAPGYFAARWLEYAVVVWQGGARSLEEHHYRGVQANRAYLVCWKEAGRGDGVRGYAEMFTRTEELAKVLYDDEPEIRDAVVTEVQRRRNQHKRVMVGYTGD